MTGSIALVTCAQFVPVVPTDWRDPGEPADLPTGEFVVKPSIEPSLFCQYDQDAAARFAAAVSRRL